MPRTKPTEEEVSEVLELIAGGVVRRPDIARELGEAPGLVTMAVGQLVEAGLVERRGSRRDRTYAVTKAGQDRADHVDAGVEREPWKCRDCGLAFRPGPGDTIEPRPGEVEIIRCPRCESCHTDDQVVDEEKYALVVEETMEWMRPLRAAANGLVIPDEDLDDEGDDASPGRSSSLEAPDDRARTRCRVCGVGLPGVDWASLGLPEPLEPPTCVPCWNQDDQVVHDDHVPCTVDEPPRAPFTSVPRPAHLQAAVDGLTLRAALDVLAQIVDLEPCALDEDGHCQAHDVEDLDCPHAAGQRLLELAGELDDDVLDDVPTDVQRLPDVRELLAVRTRELAAVRERLSESQDAHEACARHAINIGTERNALREQLDGIRVAQEVAPVHPVVARLLEQVGDPDVDPTRALDALIADRDAVLQKLDARTRELQVARDRVANLVQQVLALECGEHSDPPVTVAQRDLAVQTMVDVTQLFLGRLADSLRAPA